MTYKTIQVVVIKDPEGNIWATPKGKFSWGSVGAAKNSWSCHNWKKHPKYNNTTVNKTWKEGAGGWSVEALEEYYMVPK